MISAHYIAAIDDRDIKFSNESEKGQFMWLLQLLVDYAASGKMEDLFPSQPLQNTSSGEA